MNRSSGNNGGGGDGGGGDVARGLESSSSELPSASSLSAIAFSAASALRYSHKIKYREYIKKICMILGFNSNKASFV